MNANAVDLAKQVLEGARALSWRIATAESCTGGLVAAALTAIPGSSDVFDRGFVTYSNGAKTDMLGVSPLLIDSKGAVSREVAEAMALGALGRSAAHLAIAVTGIAGPGGGSAAKPAGLVHFAAACRASPSLDAVIHEHQEMRYASAGRDAIRALSTATALTMLLLAIEQRG